MPCMHLPVSGTHRALSIRWAHKLSAHISRAWARGSEAWLPARWSAACSWLAPSADRASQTQCQGVPHTQTHAKACTHTTGTGCTKDWHVLTPRSRPCQSRNGQKHGASPAMQGGLLIGVRNPDGCALSKGPGQDLQAGWQAPLVVAHGHCNCRRARRWRDLRGVVACAPSVAELRWRRVLQDRAAAGTGTACQRWWPMGCCLPAWPACSRPAVRGRAAHRRGCRSRPPAGGGCSRWGMP